MPMSTIATLTERAVPPSLTREQQQPSVAITSNLAGNFALGDALSRAEEIATPLLPPGSRILPLAEAATLGETNSAMITIFGFALVIILLVLAASSKASSAPSSSWRRCRLALPAPSSRFCSQAPASTPTARSGWCCWSASWPRTAS
ncbi:hypothetical protein AJ88_47475 [Mesorhizobium amorphae CCBAU 01583]|nr:hypothetical protein AJ88_47475 [Mesorhizobium amorphae CCBAU 01583]